MVYDIRKYSLESLSADERLISALMASNPMWTKADAVEKITFAYDKCDGYRVAKNKAVRSNDHAPCNNCGSIDFQRTGTCFVCMNCQESQGCS